MLGELRKQKNWMELFICQIGGERKADPLKKRFSSITFGSRKLEAPECTKSDFNNIQIPDKMQFRIFF